MKTYPLDEFLRALCSAVSASHRSMLDDQQDVARHCTRREDGVYVPQTLPMLLPNEVVGEDGAPESVHQVPTATLTQQHDLVMETMDLRFPCAVAGMEEPPGGGPPRVTIGLGGSLPPGMKLGTLSISFRQVQPPEGVARVNDKLVKKF